MGQKVNPRSMRLVRTKDWRSKWYANKQEFGQLLLEDFNLRKYLMKKPCCQGTSQIKIRRMSEKIEVTICTSRPGLDVQIVTSIFSLMRLILICEVPWQHGFFIRYLRKLKSSSSN